MFATFSAFAPFLAESNPAGGAATKDIVLATGGAMILTAIVVVVGVLHRSGRIKFLGRMATAAERQLGVPTWAALPGEVATLSLLVALLGMYWDISLHIDQGRDPGPLANPAHYLILFGLFGVFVAGFLAIILGDSRVGRSGIKRTENWKIPIGGVMLFSCAAFSLLGFPLDDGWHRLFGQDVTLWGPTHLMLFGGAGMTLIGRAALWVEGRRAAERELKAGNGNGDGDGDGQLAGGRIGEIARNLQMAGLCGGFLIGMSTFQGEFDFGVPQFQMVFQPILIAWAAGIALVTARIWAGRGGALVAVAFFLIIRGGVSVLVGPVFGETVPHFPLYIVEALIVEGVALAISTRKPIALGAISGALIGTVGFAAEWGWSHVWMPIPWASSLMPEALVWAFVAGISGGLLGGFIGAALASDRIEFPRRATAALAVGFVGILAMVGYGLNTNEEKGLKANVALTDAQGGVGGGRHVNAVVRLDPKDAGDDARWLTITAWQGGGLVVNRLKRVDEGVYRSTEPIPVSGDWKALVRLHRDNEILGTPVFLPKDPAIPAGEVPAKSEFTRGFVADKKILQREAKDASGVTPVLAYLGVLGIALGLCAMMVWGLYRLARDGQLSTQTRDHQRPAREREPARTPRVAPGV
jgi:hypothetical protein